MIILCVSKYVSWKVHAHDDTFVSVTEDSAWSPAKKKIVRAALLDSLGKKKDFFFSFTSVEIKEFTLKLHFTGKRIDFVALESQYLHSLWSSLDSTCK